MEAQLAKQDPEVVVEKALSDRVEHLGREYAQFRFSEVAQDLEVPANESVNENEWFLIRRGRFVIAGDVSEHLAIVCAGRLQRLDRAADYSLQMRNLYADVNLDAKKAFRIRPRPVEGVGQHAVEPEAWPAGTSPTRSTRGERDYGMY